MPEPDRRPAYYATRSGGWREWWTLLHPPYTAWHLSYVVLGACVLQVVQDGIILARLPGFYLDMFVGIMIVVGVVINQVIRRKY